MSSLFECRPQVRNIVTEAVLSGAGAPDLSAYAEPLGTCRSVDIEPLRGLLDEVLRRAWPEPSKSDGWLGPRVHSALRLSRAEAARSGVWTWLGLSVGYDYTIWRFRSVKTQLVVSSRFLGSGDKHAIARLWWAAELFRNGPDYSPAVRALENQDIINTFMRMDVAHHRPTAQAFLSVPSRSPGREPLSNREANALAKAVNCAAATLAYELIGPDVATYSLDPSDWISRSVVLSELLQPNLPVGPDQPRTPDESVRRLTAEFTRVFANAPIRGKSDSNDAELDVTERSGSDPEEGSSSTNLQSPEPRHDGFRSRPIGLTASVQPTENSETLASRSRGNDLSIAVGDVLRYPRDPQDEHPEIDGLRNWFFVTAAPGRSRIMLEKGINVPARTDNGRLPIVILRSSPHKAGSDSTPWFDRLSDDGGTFVYFGDNKPGTSGDSSDTWEHPRVGTQTLLQLAEEHQPGHRATRLDAAPILVVRTVASAGRQKGQVEVVGIGAIAATDRVLQQDQHGVEFENYRFEIRLLDLDAEAVSWAWVNARRSDELPAQAILELAPAAWRDWVDGR